MVERAADRKICDRPQNYEEMVSKLEKSYQSAPVTPDAIKKAIEANTSYLTLYSGREKVPDEIIKEPQSTEVKQFTSTVKENLKEEKDKVYEAAQRILGGTLPKDILPRKDTAPAA